MLSETLAAGLEHYQIGPKIRALRLKKKLGLVQLGEHTGLSPGMLSKIERETAVPDAADAASDCTGVRGRPGTLLHRKRGAAVGSGDPQERSPAPARSARMRNRRPISSKASISRSPIARWRRSTPSFRCSRSRRSRTSTPAPSSSTSSRDSSPSTSTATTSLLDEGDAMYFNSGAPHSYRREGRSACTAIVVVAPQ